VPQPQNVESEARAGDIFELRRTPARAFFIGSGRPG
jgi:hypothetical protein